MKNIQKHLVKKIARRFAKNLLESAKDILPIILVIVFFQWVVLEQNIPNLDNLLIGTAFVLVGLTMFVYGLELGLFPIAEALAYSFVKKGSLFWLLTFAFVLGFGTSFAEPALIAVANEASKVAQLGGVIDNNSMALEGYAVGLRYTVAIAVGLSVVLSMIRILKGWSLSYFIIGGYGVIILTTILAPDFIIGVAYDAGGVTTSTITVPLLSALGVGLASSIRGRNPLTDGFGVIALAALFPIVAVMIFGMLV